MTPKERAELWAQHARLAANVAEMAAIVAELARRIAHAEQLEHLSPGVPLTPDDIRLLKKETIS